MGAGIRERKFSRRWLGMGLDLMGTVYDVGDKAIGRMD
jgi:hypothetical protein